MSGVTVNPSAAKTVIPIIGQSADYTNASERQPLTS
jgi:hypothetical protein